MIELDRLHLLADMCGAHCELNHGPGIENERYPAVDYLVWPVGYRESPNVSTAVRDYAVPICQDCLDALEGEEWTLLYCNQCCSSQWVLRAISRLEYRHSVIRLRGCPKCGGRFGGCWF
jgi:hypothetical protein